MKLRELRKIISEIPPEFDNREVFLQIDPEGNGYRQVEGVSSDCITPDVTERDLYVLDSTWSADDADVPEKEWETMKKIYTPIILLYP